MLERVRPAGSWGYKLDADSVVFGPKDTWGHNGAELPYYGSGGSTGTEAPANVGGGGDEGNIPDGFNHRKLQAYTYSDGYMNYGSSYDPSTYNTGGGTLGARAYNKHGDVIPHSARGMHADYKAHEVVEMGKWYEINGPVSLPTSDHFPLVNFCQGCASEMTPRRCPEHDSADLT